MKSPLSKLISEHKIYYKTSDMKEARLLEEITTEEGNSYLCYTHGEGLLVGIYDTEAQCEPSREVLIEAETTTQSDMEADEFESETVYKELYLN